MGGLSDVAVVGVVVVDVINRERSRSRSRSDRKGWVEVAVLVSCDSAEDDRLLC